MFDKLWIYVRTYQKGVRLVDDGFCKWRVHGNRQQQAAIAKKAILLGMRVGFSEDTGDPWKQMFVKY